MRQLSKTNKGQVRTAVILAFYTTFCSGVFSLTGSSKVAAQVPQPTPSLPRVECQLTGNHAEFEGLPLCNNTSGSGRRVYGTDLGSMFSDPDPDSYNGNYDPETNNDKVYVVFGDTYGKDTDNGFRERKRPHVIATVYNFNHSQDTSSMTFRRYGWAGTRAGFDGLIDIDSANGEVTAIPTSGCSDGNNYYLWVVHIKDWEDAEGQVVSTRSVVWAFNKDFTQYSNTGYVFPSYSKFALGTMVQAQTGVDKYLYVYGTQMYRKGSVYLARTRLDELAVPEPKDHTYVLKGIVAGNPSWTKYDDDGSHEDATEAVEMITDPDYGIGELSVIKNPYNGVYMMLYYRMRDSDSSDNGTFDAQIVLRTAYNPWGPWSSPQTVMDCSQAFCYGSYMHPKFVRLNSDGTHSVYYIMSIMYLPKTSGLWDCQSHSPPCNQVYNTFLMRTDLSW